MRRREIPPNRQCMFNCRHTEVCLGGDVRCKKGHRLAGVRSDSDGSVPLEYVIRVSGPTTRGRTRCCICEEFGAVDVYKEIIDMLRKRGFIKKGKPRRPKKGLKGEVADGR